MTLRAPLFYWGGKGNLRKKLLPLIPYTKIYCEPYCGAGTILCARAPSPVEVLNDLNGNVINLFRTLQDPCEYPALRHRLEHTLYSRAEFVRSIAILSDPDSSEQDRAWAFFVNSNQGYSGTGKTAGNRGRMSSSNNGMASKANAWLGKLAHLPDWHLRFARVQIECQDALKVIKHWDRPETTFYIDPPYVLETREGSSTSQTAYTAQECPDAHHSELVRVLLEVKGACVVSGYAHELYEPLEQAGWQHDLAVLREAPVGRSPVPLPPSP